MSYQRRHGRLKLLDIDIVTFPLCGRGLLLDLGGSRATCDSGATHGFSVQSTSRRQFEKVKAIPAQEIFWWVSGPCTPATWIRRGGPSRAEHLTFIHALT